MLYPGWHVAQRWQLGLGLALLVLAAQTTAVAQPSAQQPQLPPPVPSVSSPTPPMQGGGPSATAPLHSDWRHDALGSYELGGDFMIYGNMLAPRPAAMVDDPDGAEAGVMVGARAIAAKPLLWHFVGLTGDRRNRTMPRAIALLIDGTASLGVGRGNDGEHALFISGGPRLGSNMYWRRLAYEVRLGPELLMQSGDRGTVAALGFSASMALSFPGRHGWRRQHKFVISETITPTTADADGAGEVTIWFGLGYRLQLK